MAMQRIEHVQLAMPAGEEDAARRFYSHALGMTEVPKPEQLLKRGGWRAEFFALRHRGSPTESGVLQT